MIGFALTVVVVGVLLALVKKAGALNDTTRFCIRAAIVVGVYWYLLRLFGVAGAPAAPWH